MASGFSVMLEPHKMEQEEVLFRPDEDYTITQCALNLVDEQFLQDLARLVSCGVCGCGCGIWVSQVVVQVSLVVRCTGCGHIMLRKDTDKGDGLVWTQPWQPHQRKECTEPLVVQEHTLEDLTSPPSPSYEEDTTTNNNYNNATITTKDYDSTTTTTTTNNNNNNNNTKYSSMKWTSSYTIFKKRTQSDPSENKRQPSSHQPQNGLTQPQPTALSTNANHCVHNYLPKAKLTTTPSKKSIKPFTSQPMKKKRKEIMLAKNIEVLNALETGDLRWSAASKRFALHEASVCTIFRNKNKIQESVRESAGMSAEVGSLSQRDPLLDKMEKVLIGWVVEQVEEGKSVDSLTIREKARCIYRVMFMQKFPTANAAIEFQASKVWFNRFRHQFNLQQCSFG